MTLKDDYFQNYQNFPNNNLNFMNESEFIWCENCQDKAPSKSELTNGYLTLMISSIVFLSIKSYFLIIILIPFIFFLTRSHSKRFVLNYCNF